MRTPPILSLAIAAVPVWCAVLQAQTATITVVGDADQCARATSVQVWVLTPSSNRPPPGPTEGVTIRTNLNDHGGLLTTNVTLVDGQPTAGACRWSFDNVALGDYVALLTRPDGSGGARRFVVRSSEAQTVTLPPPTVVLTGRVLRAGMPVEGVTVRIVPLPFFRPSIVTFTDSDGRYRVVLDRAGVHEIHARPVGVVEASLRDGSNEIDIVAR